MQKKIIISIIAIIVIGTVFFIIKNNNKPPQFQSANIQLEESRNNLPMSIAKNPAEKIEVVHFHASRQCWSCITVGKYALKTIKEKFPEEYEKGIIVFKDINGELPENRDMALKYQARGSSLFINTIIEGEDNIKEDVTVWRLITSEDKFVDYFENKLKALLNG